MSLPWQAVLRGGPYLNGYSHVDIPAPDVEAIIAAVRQHGQDVDRPGAGPGSLTDEGLSYRVLDGIQIDEHVPSLRALYESRQLRETVSKLVGETDLALEDHRRSSVNVNLTRGVGYELHTDPRPYTAILFLTEGAPLELHYGTSTLRIYPEPGKLVAFDGSAVPHRVVPGDSRERVSVPMQFIAPDAPPRPAGLDEHVYT